MAKDITVRAALDAASERVSGKFLDEPIVGASVRFTLGNAYRRLGEYNVADAVFVLSYLSVGGSPPPPCMKAADANDTGAVDLTDAVVVVASLFSGGPAPATPFPQCGADWTIDELTCESFAGCE